jgi:hypothetical protein
MSALPGIGLGLLRLLGMGGARAAAASAARAGAGTAARAAAPALGEAAQAALPVATGGSKFQSALNTLLVGSSLASIPLMMGFGQPGEEEQERMLKRQLEIQAEFEQSRAGAGGGVGGAMADPELAGLLQQRPRDMTGLLMDEQFSNQMVEVAKEMGKLQRQRPRGSSELEGIIAGNEAALAQMQSERVLSPMEIIQMLESMNA